ncbi:MAG TPA: hypothetical protein VGR56_00680 [Nitrososphaerales archaeon]|nr:hypothetical protein [Nitrososphaerales archaeon]
MKKLGVALLLLLFALAAPIHPISAYSPHQGDSFNYSETVVVNNGQGSYEGYTEQTVTTGMEQMNSGTGNQVASSYSYSFQFSNNQGNTTTGSKSGSYTWSPISRVYVNGTDNQVGYSKPIYVWFFMNTSLHAGAQFFILNTQFTVLSKNSSFQLPGEGRYVHAIKAEGKGQYQRNDVYGVFSASYTSDEYFDPVTGFIVGYHYVEQDNGEFQGVSGSFTYTDDLYVTSTSYPLATASAPPLDIGLILEENFVYIAVVAILAIVIVVVVFVARSVKKRRGLLPRHPPAPYVPPPPPPAWGSTVDMGSKPPQQVVIREVAKTHCKYCGTQIPTTVDRCPYCGGPQ